MQNRYLFREEKKKLIYFNLRPRSPPSLPSPTIETIFFFIDETNEIWYEFENSEIYPLSKFIV